MCSHTATPAAAGLSLWPAGYRRRDPRPVPFWYFANALTDQLGNITTLVWNNGYRIGAIDALGNGTSYSYNSNGQLLAVQNPLGQVATQVYNAVGQLVGRINPLGQRATYAYNANGMVQSVQNALGEITTFLRDDVNRLMRGSTRWEMPRAISTMPTAD